MHAKDDVNSEPSARFYPASPFRRSMPDDFPLKSPKIETVRCLFGFDCIVIRISLSIKARERSANPMFPRSHVFCSPSAAYAADRFHSLYSLEVVKRFSVI